MKNKLCIISGPTATGKTAISVELARKYSGEVINFDSLLFYKELNIGTAKPSIEEMGKVPHHMINTHSIANPINAASYIDLALPIINKLHSERKKIFLVGGSGFYLQALLYGMYKSTTTPAEIMKRSNELYEKEGITPFLDMLKQKDQHSYNKYHENDHYRIRRAVEHFWTTSKPFSASRNEMDQTGPESHWVKYNWDLNHIYLDIPKDLHLEVITNRAHRMIEAGLVTEVKNILAMGHSGNEKPLQSIGYKETQSYLEGKISSRDELIDKIAIATRQLAKGQRTWFKKQDKKSYNPLNEKEKIFEDVKTFFND